MELTYVGSNCQNLLSSYEKAVCHNILKVREVTPPWSYRTALIGSETSLWARLSVGRSGFLFVCLSQYPKTSGSYTSMPLIKLSVTTNYSLYPDKLPWFLEIYPLLGGVVLSHVVFADWICSWRVNNNHRIHINKQSNQSHFIHYTKVEK